MAAKVGGTCPTAPAATWRRTLLVASTCLLVACCCNYKWRPHLPRTVAGAAATAAPSLDTGAATAAAAPLPTPFSTAARVCSCVLFRHLAKTGGSTIQTILRRHEQIASPPFFYAAHGTWVEIRPKEWNVLFREITADPDAFLARHPRLLVSFHKQTAEQFAPRTVEFERNGVKVGRDPTFHIWDDIQRLRRLYRDRGCSFTLATLLREPASLYYSDYLFEGAYAAAPAPGLADFMGQDVQSAALLGWPFGWNAKRHLTAAQRNLTYEMLDGFDLVGITERFDESLLLLAALGGLPHHMYRRMNDFGGSAASRRALAKLKSDGATSAAVERLSAFDAEVYRHYAARFERRAAAAGASFQRRLHAFHNATTRDAGRRQGGGGMGLGAGGALYVGGMPPADRYMVTTDYVCPRTHPVGTWPRTDYGGCDTRLGERGGPTRLDQLKAYVPCHAANCTKVAADGYSCSHMFVHQETSKVIKVEGQEPHHDRTYNLRPWLECRIDSSPDGLM